MERIEQATGSWATWVQRAPDKVLATITSVQLNAEGHGGYDVHVHLWDVDQAAVDNIAAALGCASNLGWEPKNEDTARQWSLDREMHGLSWHVTATQAADPPVPARPLGTP